MGTSKKIGVATIATIALTLSSAMHSNANASVAPFKDLEKAAPWAKVLIQEAQEKNLLSGDHQGYFHPLTAVTRQEAAAALAKAMGLQQMPVTKISFSDVSADLWSASAIEAVRQAGWMKGDSQGNFRPKDVLSREELATILARATQSNTTDDTEGDLSTLKDNQKISNWAKESVSTMVTSGLMTGSNGSFYPQNSVLRQELAAILLRLDQETKSSHLQTIDKIEDNKVIIGDKTYSVSDSLKPFFSAKNTPVLTNAVIRFEAVDGQISQLLQLELVTPGKPAALGQSEFSGNLVLDGGDTIIQSNVKVAADYITIKNISINGDLEIGKELNNDFYAERIQVKGTTFVNGGDDNTVVFDQSTLKGMNIAKEDVRVEAINKTVIDKVYIESTLSGLWGDESITYNNVTIDPSVTRVSLYAHIANLEIVSGSEAITLTGNGKFDSLIIKGAGDVSVLSTGPIGSITITDKTAKVTLPSNVAIQSVVLPQGVSPEQVIENYNAVKSQIVNINGASNPGYTVPSVGSSNPSAGGTSSGGTGGGNTSNPGTSPTPSNPNPVSRNPFVSNNYENRKPDSVDVTSTVNATGTIYYMAVRLDDNVQPTAEQIKSGTLPGNLSYVSGSVSAVSNQPTVYTLNELDPSNAYGIWAYFKNTETGEESRPYFLITISNYVPNTANVLPYERKNLSQIRIQFSGELTPAMTSTLNPFALIQDGRLRNYGFGYIPITSISWDLDLPDMPILELNFDPVNLGTDTSYRLDWSYVKDALSIQVGSSRHSFGKFGSYSGQDVVSLITTQLAIEAGTSVDPSRAEDVLHVLGVYPSPLNQELGLIEFNAQYYQKALVEAGTYSTFADVKQIISAVNAKYPAPSTNEATAIRTFNSAVNAANMEANIKRYATILNIDVTGFDQLHSIARNEVAQSILDQRNHLPESKFSSIQEIKAAYEEAFSGASATPVNLNFVDTDSKAGSVGGDITWSPGKDESSVVSYELLWGTNGRSTSSIATVDKNAGYGYSILPGTPISADTTQLFIRALLQDGTYTPSIFITVKDKLPSAPEKPNLTKDETKNTIIGADASMEFSVDNGTTWIPYDELDPPVFPGNARVQVRLQADPVNQIPAGKTASLSFTDQVAILIYHNDSTNTFDTMYISSTMEYSFDDGASWTSYDEVNPPQFPGDLTILLREKGGRYLPAGPAKSFTFTSNVNVKKTVNSLTPLTSTLEYSMDGVDWSEFSRGLVLSFQVGDTVEVREAARGPFPAGTATTIIF
ncbi:S-layer homology domain-containing protein [Paenibacillus sp. OK060]|uniref:DUF4073 domain-containing protein n=1 Tax=Paenibacillus sp. OK060 TaxID=1881034 RepID=UPI000883CBC1|nr:DUF4073 domain-containing protein [Paenibacillus sp. OK060]SDM41794.1 S-layer homology domain-containing protein [Paenibacillus sp. OK060]